MNPNLFPSPLMVLDFETSGLDFHTWARPIELAAVLLDTAGREWSRFETFIRPDILDGRASKALEINQITREMLADAPSMDAAADAFNRWAEPTTGPAHYVTSYNRAFDESFARRMGLVDLRWANCVMVRACRIMGPLGLLRDADPTHPRFRPDLPWLFPPLVQVAAHFDVPVVGTPHRALTDARTAAGVAVAIRRMETACTP